MKTYVVTITETLEKEVVIKAKNPIDAKEAVRREWNEGVHVLDASNFTEVRFYTEEIQNN